MADAKFNDTKQSLDSLTNTITGDWSTGWGVEVSHDQYANEFNSNLNGVINASITLGNNIYSTGQMVVDTFTNPDQYTDLADAAGSAALNYLNQKIQRIKDAWTTTTTVSVGALIGEVAPYCLDFTSAISKVGTKVSSLVGYLLDVDGSSWENLGSGLLEDVSSSLMNDPSVSEAVSNLGVIKSFASALNTVTSMINVVNSVLKVLEPAFPFLEIATNIASSFMTGGVSAGEAGSRTTQVVEAECQKLISLLAYSLRKALYDINIQVPVLLVGALETLSVRDAMMGYDRSNNAWLKAIFDEEFYRSTINSLTWQQSISEALNSVINWSDASASELIAKMLGENNQSVLGENMKNRFLSEMTKNFMNRALAEARKKAYITEPGQILWLTSDDFSDIQNTIIGGYEKPISLGSMSNTQKILNDDYDQRPITDENSIRIISKTIYDCIA